MYTRFNRDYVQTISKFNQNAMYCVLHNVLLKDGVGHMNARKSPYRMARQQKKMVAEQRKIILNWYGKCLKCL
jgi:hypothetical protein